MRELYGLVKTEDGALNMQTHLPLFSDHEKERAERILNALNGMSSA